ncbi:hypothetical protein ABZ869_10680 [Streptomyces sp. NPDC046928]|uniref:hypothetical protein n=1 Tax=Streptomyces sp. NPDC046928 TaxID=3155021 RepID=UPI003407DE33
MLRKRTLGLAAAAAALFTLIGAVPASASTVTGTSVSTGWGYAEAKTQWRLNPYRLDPVYLYVKDKAADGHGVAVRLVTTGDAGTVRFQLRRVSTGNGTYGEWYTYATPGGWISRAYIELCQMEGTTVLQCASSSVMYPAYDDSGNADPF